MARPARKHGLRLWLFTGAIAAGLVSAQAYGLRLNTTASAPRGLWRVVARAPLLTLRRGMIVSVCPPVAPVVLAMRDKGYLGPGYCAGTSTVPLLKPVAAVAGDLVTVAPGRPLEVNGTPLPNTIQEADMPAVPAGTYRVLPGTIWLLDSYDRGSFDSRYFGPVPLALVRGQVIPVLVEGDARRLTPGAVVQEWRAP